MTFENKNQENDKQPTLWDSFSIGNEINDIEFIDYLLTSILGLVGVPGLGFKSIVHLFDKKLLPGLVDNPAAYNLASVYKDFPKYKTAHQYIKLNRDSVLKSGKLLKNQLNKNHIVFLPYYHPKFPKSLLKIDPYPRWIFVRGNIDAINSDSIIAIVGTRKPVIDGQRLSFLCASQLARKNIVVLSGLASGIDEKAHKGALSSYGQTIAVLGFGINSSYYPDRIELENQIIENGGAIISEYLPDDSPTKESFLRRNSLQVALSKVVIPIETPSLDSGTGATIRRAINMNVPIIGVTAEMSSINPENLISTRINLTSLGIPIFNIVNGQSTEYWGIIKALLPQHNWNNSNSSLEKRFFVTIEKEIQDNITKFGFEPGIIERLIKYLSDKSR